MTRHVKAIVASIAVTLVLTLALAAQAVGKTGAVNWVCNVDGQDVTFVSAPEAARHGIEQANDKAGAVFNDQFGEICRVEPPG
jgi:hypothetical protein